MRRRFSTALFLGRLWLLSTGGVLAPSLASAGTAPVEAARAERFFVDLGNAMFTFPTPRRFAVVQQAAGKIRRIYTDGNVLGHDKASGHSVLVERVSAEGMVVRDTRTGREHLVRPGQPVPASPGTTFVGTVLLTQVEYRLREVDHVIKEEPVLIMLADTVAILEQQVPPRGSKVRVNQVDEETFIVDGATWWRAIEEVGRTISPEMLRLRETLSVSGMGVEISSDAGTATLDSGGFTVTSLKVDPRFGVQVGDTIVSLNGHRVNSPLNAWGIFQDLFTKNRDLTELRVGIHRRGTRLNKTYRIR